MSIDATRVILAACWISLMLIYLLGDVLRLFAGYMTPGEINGKAVADSMWTLAAIIMLVPIAMILVSLMVPAGPLRWITIVVAAGLVLFNLSGMPYKGFFDNMLLVVSFAVNGILIWQAIVWRPAVAA